MRLICVRVSYYATARQFTLLEVLQGKTIAFWGMTCWQGYENRSCAYLKLFLNFQILSWSIKLCRATVGVNHFENKAENSLESVK